MHGILGHLVAMLEEHRGGIHDRMDEIEELVRGLKPQAQAQKPPDHEDMSISRELLTAINRDAERDKQVVEALGRNLAAIEENSRLLRELTAVLCAPKERTGVVHLPSGGTVGMTITERSGVH
jgi:hypothetical protein